MRAAAEGRGAGEAEGRGAGEAEGRGAGEAEGRGAGEAEGRGALVAEGRGAGKAAGRDRPAARAALRVATAAVALVGLGIATYLTTVHYAGGSPVCAIAHGCSVVQHSEYATVAGIPVAVIGLGGYVAILASLVRDDEAARTATAFLALAGLGFSAWLTYVEVGVLDAICIWCVGSAICMAALAALSVARLLKAA